MPGKATKPPKQGKWLLSLFTRYEEDHFGSGDFSEEYAEKAAEYGKVRAFFWYWGQILHAVPSSLKLSLLIGGSMFKNYIKITLRHLKKYKMYSILNITGLVVGLTCSALIYMYVRYELSYDRYHKNAANIYRVIMKQNGNVWLGTDLWNANSGILKPVLLENFPEVEKATRLRHRSFMVQTDDHYYVERRFFFVDPEFLEVFTYPLIKGDPTQVLRTPMTLLLVREKAYKYFGSEDPIGRTLKVGDNEYVIEGILEDIPGNSHFKFDFLASFQSLYAISIDQNENIERWGYNNYSTYLSLRDDIDPTEMGEKITQLVASQEQSDRGNEYILQPLTDIHLHSRVNREFNSNSDIRYIYIFSAIAVFLLLIAGFNYMNLATAQAFYRTKEVGIRKIVGAGRRQISCQFFGEAVLFSTLGLTLSLILIRILLPAFSSFVERDLSFGLLRQTGFFMMFLLISLVLGMVSGIYPAVFLAATQPLRIIKGSRPAGTQRQAGFRNTLVVIQFVISITMIVSTLALYNQLSYIKHKNLGFRKDNIVSFNIYDKGLREKYEPFKNELLKNPGISDVTVSSNALDFNSMGGGARWEGKQEDERINFYRLFVDYNFFDFFGIELLQGRNFSQEVPTDSRHAYILNQAAVDSIGWEDPLDKLFRHWAPEDGSVVGVVENFHFQTLRLKIEPLIITPAAGEVRKAHVSVKLRPENLPDTLSFIERTYNRFSPGYPFDLSFLDERLNRLYRTDQRLGLMFTYFTVIAIIVACLGLFGLGSFTAEKRTKEIGIRKVLGATIFRIVFMLSKEFLRWVLLAALVAFPIAWYAMNKWLENFAYRTPLEVGIFASALLIALLISLIALGYKSFLAASANPVKSLRNE